MKHKSALAPSKQEGSDPFEFKHRKCYDSPMSFTPTFENLTQTQRYNDNLDDLNSENAGFSFFSVIKNQLPLKVNCLFISNYITQKKASIHYILRIDRNKINLFESSQLAENTSEYVFSEKKTYLNKNPMGDLYKTAFKRRLSEIIHELKHNACAVYEEPI